MSQLNSAINTQAQDDSIAMLATFKPRFEEDAIAIRRLPDDDHTFAQPGGLEVTWHKWRGTRKFQSQQDVSTFVSMPVEVIHRALQRGSPITVLTGPDGQLKPISGTNTTYPDKQSFDHMDWHPEPLPVAVDDFSSQCSVQMDSNGKQPASNGPQSDAPSSYAGNRKPQPVFVRFIISQDDCTSLPETEHENRRYIAKFPTKGKAKECGYDTRGLVDGTAGQYDMMYADGTMEKVRIGLSEWSVTSGKFDLNRARRGKQKLWDLLEPSASKRKGPNEHYEVPNSARPSSAGQGRGGKPSVPIYVQLPETMRKQRMYLPDGVSQDEDGTVVFPNSQSAKDYYRFDHDKAGINAIGVDLEDPYTGVTYRAKIGLDKEALQSAKFGDRRYLRNPKKSLWRDEKTVRPPKRPFVGYVEGEVLE